MLKLFYNLEVFMDSTDRIGSASTGPSLMPVASRGALPVPAATLPSAGFSWHERAVSYLDTYEKRLDVLMPNFFVQDKLDSVGLFIKELFSPLSQFSQWLDDNGQGEWYQQLAVSLRNLPVKAVRNIIRMLYSIIKEILYTLVHPLKSLSHLTKTMVLLANELTKSETWTKIGVGSLGGCLGQALMVGNPVLLIALGIGGALTLTGLTATLIKTLVQAEEGKRVNAAQQVFLSSALDLPEALFTGICMGLITGGVQRVMKRLNAAQAKPFRISTNEEAYKAADRIIKKYRLPAHDGIEFNSNGDLIINWNKYSVQSMNFKRYPKVGRDTIQCLSAKLIIKPDAEELVVRYVGATADYEYISYWNDYPPVHQLGIWDSLYPLEPTAIAVNAHAFTHKLGSAVGAMPALISQQLAHNGFTGPRA